MVSRRSDWRDELRRWLNPFLDRLGHKRSARGGVDQCGDMGYATINGIELRIFYQGAKGTWVERRKTIDAEPEGSGCRAGAEARAAVLR
jgi:hypothetical protein